MRVLLYLWSQLQAYTFHGSYKIPATAIMTWLQPATNKKGELINSTMWGTFSTYSLIIRPLLNLNVHYRTHKSLLDSILNYGRRNLLHSLFRYVPSPYYSHLLLVLRSGLFASSLHTEILYEFRTYPKYAMYSLQISITETRMQSAQMFGRISAGAVMQKVCLVWGPSWTWKMKFSW